MKEASMEKEKSEYGNCSEYDVKCAVDTLIKAEEIKADSELMSYVKPLLEAKLKGAQSAISSIKDIKEARQKLDKEETEESDTE